MALVSAISALKSTRSDVIVVASVSCIFGAGNPDIFDLFNYGNICFREGNYEEASKSFLRVIELDKHNKKAWYNLGNSYDRRGLFLEAEKAYKEALKIDENYFLALLNLSNVLNAQGKSEEAEKIDFRRDEVAKKFDSK